MRKESRKFLERYLNNASPTGFESSGQQIWLDYVKPYVDDYMVDTYGSVAAIINPGKDYKVVIEAHADEIAWFVNYISSDGYISVSRLGGSDHQIAPSMRVNLHGEKGVVKGVFGWPAIHVRDRMKEEQPSLKNLFIDIGASSKNAVEEAGIFVGTVATFEGDVMDLGKDFITGRAFDNRIGGFMIAEVARMISEKKVKLPYTLYIVNAVQEEIGLRGAEMISRSIRPDVAVITDVTHDTTTPMYDKKTQGEIKCGGGPTLTTGPAVQNNLLKMIIDVARKKKIEFQRTTAGRSTGTDTDSFAYSAEGVASALISLPLRYMHTTVETVHKDDIDGVIKLMFEFVKQLPAGTDFRYFK
ncbi:MAG: M20/M25/M40 family metallo-hydrolase [Flavobacteriales bacterium]|nr:M20/M25/M40 family metallo-hydrolase [Flavobacteriales bacterium]